MSTFDKLNPINSGHSDLAIHYDFRRENGCRNIRINYLRYNSGITVELESPCAVRVVFILSIPYLPNSQKS